MLKFTTTFLLCTVLFTNSAAAAISYPLQISSDGRMLLEATGKPLFLNATTPWHIVARLDQSEVIEFLDARQEQGFNAILMSLVVPGGYSGSVLNAYGEAPFTTAGNFSTPNEAYFAHADWIIDQAHQRDMVVLLCHTYVGYGCGSEGWCAEMKSQGTNAMRNWGRWLGQRYRDVPNIIWVNGGDVDADAYGAGSHVDAIANGILQYDSQHLHTAHCARFLSGVDCYDRAWLDLDTTYGDCSGTGAEVKDSYQHFPVRPNLYIEGRYEEGNGGTAECMRRQAWIPTLGGAIGQAYGHETVWDFPSGWRNQLGDPGAASMDVLKNFVDSRPWSDLVPDHDHITLVSGYGNISSSNFVPAARARDGSSIVAYLPAQTSVSVDLARVSGQEAEVWWMDPRNGDAELMGLYPTSGVHSFVPPAPGDWVLVIDDTAAPLPDLSSPATAAPEQAPARLQVGDPYPNPFNPRTSIRFSATAGSRVTVDAFDAHGRHVAQLFDGIASGGDQSFVWQAQDQPSGVYYLRFRSGDEVQKKRIALVR